jgi:putative DNA primase/helicase
MKPFCLHYEHLADLKKSGLKDETIRAAGVYTVPPDEVGKKLGGLANGVVSALAFPYPECGGFERFKAFRDEGKTGPKYLQKAGTPNHLYLPPKIDLTEESPLLVVEGEKKALALWQAGYQVVGIGGIWNWCEKAEGYKKPKESRPIPDLDKVNWRRPVTIIFDSDGHDNPLVRLAAFRLARELSRRGAAVSILFLPHGKNGEEVGADDFLVAHGAEKLREMMP